jgi:DNA-binding MarR family transcriptional regulator
MFVMEIVSYTSICGSNPGYPQRVTELPVAMMTWRSLHLADTVICEELGARLAEQPGCSLTEHDLLAWLAAAPGDRLRMLDLADRLHVSPGGLTRIIDRLVRRGWVRRHRPEDNRREVYVILTGPGQTARRTAQVAYSQVIENTLTALLDEQDLTALGQISHKLLRGLRPAHGSLCPPPESPRQAKAGADATQGLRSAWTK